MYHANLSSTNPEAVALFVAKEQDAVWSSILITSISPGSSVNFYTKYLPEDELVQLSNRFPEEEFDLLMSDDYVYESYTIKAGQIHLDGWEPTDTWG